VSANHHYRKCLVVGIRATLRRVERTVLFDISLKCNLKLLVSFPHFHRRARELPDDNDVLTSVSVMAFAPVVFYRRRYNGLISLHFDHIKSIPTLPTTQRYQDTIRTSPV
jgi:hypothetical protein